MDLPTCRACGQSVLDDDAEDCPFCGASMKTGQPKKGAAVTGAAKPAAGGKAGVGASKAAAGKGAVGATTAKPTPSKSATGAGRAAPPMGLDDDDDLPPPTPNDDPFELEKKAGGGAGAAIPLRPSPAKGYSLKLTCPMCETVGYATPKAAGQSVKCANPKCLVPVFTAPAPKVEKAAPPPPPPPSRMPLILTGLALLLAAGGAGMWYGGVFDTLFAPKKHKLTEAEIKELVQEKPRPGEQTAPTVKPEQKPETPAATNAGEPPMIAALRKKAYELLVDASRDQDAERGKAMSRRMAAEIAVLNGDIPEARNQIEQLQKRSANLDFYAIPPLVEIGWHELQAGKSDAAQAAAKEAVDSMKKLPPFGRDSTEISLRLASLQAAIGKIPEAEGLVRKLDSQTAYGVLSNPLLESSADGTYDFAAAAANEPMLPWTAPNWVAVTKLLAVRGAWDAALQFAKRAPSPEAKAECCVAAGEVAVKTGDAGRIESLTAALEGLPASARARVLAALAYRQALAGRNEPAGGLLKQAKEALAGEKVPTAYVLPPTSALMETDPPDPVAARLGAHAAAEVARAEAALGKRDDAVASLQTSLAFARAIGPSPSVLREKVDAADNGTAAVKAQLKTELKLKSSDETDRAMNNYRRQLGKMATAAEARLDVEGRLLAALAATPLRDAVWDVIRKGSEGSGEEREPLFDTAAPWELVDSFRAAGMADNHAVKKALDEREQPPDAAYALRHQVDSLVAARKPDQAGAAVDASDVDKTWKQRLVLLITARLAKAGRVDAAMQFIRGLKSDVIVREEALAQTAALASRSGHAREVWAATETKGLHLSERAALYRGFLAGSVNGDQEGKPL